MQSRKNIEKDPQSNAVGFFFGLFQLDDARVDEMRDIFCDSISILIVFKKKLSEKLFLSVLNLDLRVQMTHGCSGGVYCWHLNIEIVQQVQFWLYYFRKIDCSSITVPELKML